METTNHIIYDITELWKKVRIASADVSVAETMTICFKSKRKI